MELGLEIISSGRQLMPAVEEGSRYSRPEAAESVTMGM